ncbi:MAG: hypothetical protein RIC55_02515 [Pirellulaceae bacterium]
MSSFGLTMRATQAFFDRQKVQARVDRAERRVLSRAGAFIRRRARSSIRRRKRTASPGQPPSAHSTDRAATLKNILFAYEEQSQSVVIGPVKLNGQKGHVPRLLEEGGTATIERRRGKQRVRVVAHYHAFPFMGPALEAEAPKFPDLWRDQVRE